jgi:starvation-inducible DNA-binding protein
MPTPQDKLAARRRAARATPSDLGPKAVKHISGALNVLLADVFALYLKNKNFHRHMSAPHFRDFRLLLDEHGDQIFAMTDAIAERKPSGSTIRSIGHVARLQPLGDNDAQYVDPFDMLAELLEDNRMLLASMREAHDLCDEKNDGATASLLKVCLDETERRIWSLFEIGRRR